MRKTIINAAPPELPRADWLDLENLASIEITSEDPAHPIEAALTLAAGSPRGWRAAQAGEQIIRIIFDQPQRLRRIWLLITETENVRSQELSLRWSPNNGQTFREIIRQQWNFSPAGSTVEVEDYRVDLDAITMLELRIVADRNGGAALASLDRLRLL